METTGEDGALEGGGLVGVLFLASKGVQDGSELTRGKLAGAGAEDGFERFFGGGVRVELEHGFPRQVEKRAERDAAGGEGALEAGLSSLHAESGGARGGWGGVDAAASRDHEDAIGRGDEVVDPESGEPVGTDEVELVKDPVSRRGKPGEGELDRGAPWAPAFTWSSLVETPGPMGKEMDRGQTATAAEREGAQACDGLPDPCFHAGLHRARAWVG